MPSFGHLARRPPEDELSAFLAGVHFEISSFDHQHGNPRAECRDRVIGDIEIICYIGGKATITVGERQYGCSRGMIAVIPPYQLHSIQTTPDDPHDNYFVHFAVRPVYLLDRVAQLLRPTETHTASRLPAFSRIESSMRDLDREFERAEPGALAAITTALRAIVVELARDRYEEWRKVRPEAALEPDGLAHRDVLDRAVRVMSRELGRTLTIDELCAEVGVGRSALFEHFQRTFGAPPMHFYRWMRLRHAGVLLATSDASIKEIAFGLGFSSPFHFSQAFKQQYGLSPSAYRAQPLM